MINTDVEQAFLASILVWEDKELYWITEDNFYISTNKDIFKAIEETKNEWWSPDLISIRWKLKRDVTNQKLLELTNWVYSLYHQEHYASLLKNNTKKIELSKIASKIMLYAENSDKINWEVFDFANELLSLNTMSEDNYNIDNDIFWLMSYLEERKWKDLFWYSWWENLQFLDKYTKWIQKGRTYRIWAPSNLWKTWLSYNIINWLIKQWAKVAFFTLENDKSFTLANILANHQEVNSYDIENWNIQADVDYIKWQEWKLFIIDTTYELWEIFSKIMEIKPDVVILDYIWLVQIKKTKEDDKYTEYSKQVQEFVKRSRVGWIDLSNLPKWQEDEETIRAFGWFYGSSFLKNNADVWIHLTHYKKFYDYKKTILTWSEDLDIVFWCNDENEKVRNYQVTNLLITKNRIWTAKVETIYKIDFNKWWKFKEATQEELNKWSV